MKRTTIQLTDSAHVVLGRIVESGGSRGDYVSALVVDVAAATERAVRRLVAYGFAGSTLLFFCQCIDGKDIPESPSQLRDTLVEGGALHYVDAAILNDVAYDADIFEDVVQVIKERRRGNHYLLNLLSSKEIAVHHRTEPS